MAKKRETKIVSRFYPALGKKIEGETREECDEKAKKELYPTIKEENDM